MSSVEMLWTENFSGDKAGNVAQTLVVPRTPKKPLTNSASFFEKFISISVRINEYQLILSVFMNMFILEHSINFDFYFTLSLDFRINLKIVETKSKPN
ncbi:unnamed protein product [Meloidogyne enterolobii]|uniref:Uncharacterized protein n=1 Tax=Meloidogyne enterolobii TaxID=390850 RepID=A0ACB0YQP8_MELEN